MERAQPERLASGRSRHTCSWLSPHPATHNPSHSHDGQMCKWVGVGLDCSIPPPQQGKEWSGPTPSRKAPAFSVRTFHSLAWPRDRQCADVHLVAGLRAALGCCPCGWWASEHPVTSPGLHQTASVITHHIELRDPVFVFVLQAPNIVMQRIRLGSLFSLSFADVKSKSHVAP